MCAFISFSLFSFCFRFPCPTPRFLFSIFSTSPFLSLLLILCVYTCVRVCSLFARAPSPDPHPVKGHTYEGNQPFFSWSPSSFFFVGFFALSLSLSVCDLAPLVICFRLVCVCVCVLASSRLLLFAPSKPSVRPFSFFFRFVLCVSRV